MAAIGADNSGVVVNQTIRQIRRNDAEFALEVFPDEARHVTGAM